MSTPEEAREPAGSLFGVAGLQQTVESSLQPELFAAAFAELGMRAWYVPIPIREKSVRKGLRSLPRLGFRGVNVEAPLKELAAEVAHTRSELVERTGTADLLVIDADMHIHAEAIDGQVLLEALADAGTTLRGATVNLVGAGGAGTDIAFAMGAAGVATLRVWNRHVRRSSALAKRLQVVFPAMTLEVRHDLPIHVPAHVLISAVPQEAIPAALLKTMHEGATVVDLAYRFDRQPTALAEAARSRAAACIDGQEILVRRGARTFRHWFGTDPPLEVMARAVR